MFINMKRDATLIHSSSDYAYGTGKVCLKMDVHNSISQRICVHWLYIRWFVDTKTSSLWK